MYSKVVNYESIQSPSSKLRKKAPNVFHSLSFEKQAGARVSSTLRGARSLRRRRKMTNFKLEAACPRRINAANPQRQEGLNRGRGGVRTMHA